MCNGEPVDFQSCQLHVVNASTLVETICNDSSAELSIPVDVNGYSGSRKIVIMQTRRAIQPIDRFKNHVEVEPLTCEL